MEKLCCDICGGTLVMQSGGKVAVCDSCGMQYSTERMREKVQEIKGVVSIEGTVRTQDADFIIRGGVLERYNGNDVHVVIPDSVVKIGKQAFEKCVGIQSVILPPNVEEIDIYAFGECKSLEQITLSQTVKIIGVSAFQGCNSLKQITLPQTVQVIGSSAFQDCTSLEEINIPDQVEKISGGAFRNCPSLRKVIISEMQKKRLLINEFSGNYSIEECIFEESDDDDIPVYSAKNCGPWYMNVKRELEAEVLRKTQEKRRADGKCQYCGGYFTGVFTKKCAWCHKPKDY